uniref:Uncharacterized protein n=1 Tax=Rhizophora mucronata TaxID=61149 RepID=A0A2P2K872_RHIMU
MKLKSSKNEYRGMHLFLQRVCLCSQRKRKSQADEAERENKQRVKKTRCQGADATK